MSFGLSSEESQYIDGLVATGRFASTDDLVREGLRLLISREQLRAEVQVGMDAIDAGEVIPAEEVFAKLYARNDRRLAEGS